MNCSEFKENVAAFALDALAEDERLACEGHLAGEGPHEGCEEELRRAYETVALLGASLPGEAPGEHVWSAIERELAAGRAGVGVASSPVRRPEAVPPPRSRGARWREASAWGLAAAAAVAAFLLLGRWRTEEGRRADLESRLASTDRALREVETRFATARDELEGRLRSTDGRWQACLDDLRNARVSLDERDRALRLLGAPSTLLVQLAAQGEVPYHASALVNGPDHEAILLSSSLVPQAGKDYQLWFIRGDQKISAGLLDVDPKTGVTLASIDPALLGDGAPDAIAVTLEPEGGRPQPTGPIVLLGRVGA